MKKIIAIILVLFLTGCTQDPTFEDNNTFEPTISVSTPDSVSATDLVSTTEETTPTPVPMELAIYCGNENADGFNTISYEVYYFNSYTIIEKLIEAGALADGITLNYEQYSGTCLHLDFNDTLLKQLNSTGSAGEYIIIGSIVNTFLDNYNDVATSIYITVNGDIIESGHVIYDFMLTRFE